LLRMAWIDEVINLKVGHAVRALLARELVDLRILHRLFPAFVRDLDEFLERAFVGIVRDVDIHERRRAAEILALGNVDWQAVFLRRFLVLGPSLWRRELQAEIGLHLPAPNGHELLHLRGGGEREKERERDEERADGHESRIDDLENRRIKAHCEVIPEAERTK